MYEWRHDNIIAQPFVKRKTVSGKLKSDSELQGLSGLPVFVSGFWQADNHVKETGKPERNSL